MGTGGHFCSLPLPVQESKGLFSPLLAPAGLPRFVGDHCSSWPKAILDGTGLAEGFKRDPALCTPPWCFHPQALLCSPARAVRPTRWM